MSLWEMEVTQTDCPHVYTTQRYASLRVVIMGTEVIGRYERIFSVLSCPTVRELRAALNFFQNNEKVREFKLLSSKSGVATALYLIPKTSMFRKTSQIGLRIHPLIAKGGREKWYFISDHNKQDIRSFVSDEFTQILSMKRKRPAEIFRAFYTAVQYLMPALSISDKISQREIELVRAAQERGFFAWPRRTSLTSLSRELDMPKSTLSYHFRSVEKKMADALS